MAVPTREVAISQNHLPTYFSSLKFSTIALFAPP